MRARCVASMATKGCWPPPEKLEVCTGRGAVVEGVIGSSEIWNSEIDRIRAFHDRFGTTAEEMETASAAQIAGLFQIPFLGIRVVSNNITNGGTYDAATGEACQEYVYDVVRGYVGEKLKR